MVQTRSSTIIFRRRLFFEAAAIVEKEYGSDLDLDQVARRVMTSRRQLQRVFAEIGNTTFRRYLTEVRMSKATDLLITQDIPIKEIARRVGYRQPAQFAKAFRRHLGIPPTTFREANNQLVA